MIEKSRQIHPFVGDLQILGGIDGDMPVNNQELVKTAEGADQPAFRIVGELCPPQIDEPFAQVLPRQSLDRKTVLLRPCSQL